MSNRIKPQQIVDAKDQATKYRAAAKEMWRKALRVKNQQEKDDMLEEARELELIAGSYAFIDRMRFAHDKTEK